MQRTPGRCWVQQFVAAAKKQDDGEKSTPNNEGQRSCWWQHCNMPRWEMNANVRSIVEQAIKEAQCGKKRTAEELQQLSAAEDHAGIEERQNGTTKNNVGADAEQLQVAKKCKLEKQEELPQFSILEQFLESCLVNEDDSCDSCSNHLQLWRKKLTPENKWKKEVVLALLSCSRFPWEIRCHNWDNFNVPDAVKNDCDVVLARLPRETSCRHRAFQIPAALNNDK